MLANPGAVSDRRPRRFRAPSGWSSASRPTRPGGIDARRHRPSAEPRRHSDVRRARSRHRTAGSAELELTLAALAAGDYLLELTAKAEGGSAQELIAFRLGR